MLYLHLVLGGGAVNRDSRLPVVSSRPQTVGSVESLTPKVLASCTRHERGITIPTCIKLGAGAPREYRLELWPGWACNGRSDITDACIPLTCACQAVVAI